MFHPIAHLSMQHNPAYSAPFPRTKLSMHVQFICEHWHRPAQRDHHTVGLRVDYAHFMMKLQQPVQRPRKGAKR